MRRVLAILVITATVIVSASAQRYDGVTVDRYAMERVGDSLRLDIRFNATKLDIRNNEVAVITPMIVKDEESIALRSCGIYSRMRDIYYARNEHLSPTTDADMRFRERRVPETIDYHVVLAYADWMENCSVVIARQGYGCCGGKLWSESETLIERFPYERYIPEMIYLRPEIEVVKTRALRGSAYIDFPVSRTEIYLDYHDNKNELRKITGTIDSVKNDRDITIRHLSIKGFASPESPYDNNARLAKGRTAALKAYVENMYHFGEGFIDTSYEPENWEGLEVYVEHSTLPHRNEILAAIRSAREPDNKERFIKSNWPEDYRYLLDNCYPRLRRSDYVIEYEIRSYTKPEEIEAIMFTAPQKLSLEEFYILAESYDQGSDLYNEVWEIAIRMYPSDPVANLNAANTAMLKGDYTRALRYLDKAGDSAEVLYGRGLLEVLCENFDAARPYLLQAEKMGLKKAREVLDNIHNRWIVTSDDIEKNK
ncbi:MAG: DUF3868 domain-containing protein [Rikenellaceae bacterium]|nr:DUF3868 domain-containing protein [Rikenellaceae bacterium]